MPDIQKKKEIKNNILINYLEKQKSFIPRINYHPSPNLHFCIVIPCFNEPDLIATLDSIKANKLPEKDTEIIVVINSPENVFYDIFKQNNDTISQLRKWQHINNSNRLSLQYIHVSNIPLKTAGAGYARKIGMDEAIYRLKLVNNPEGIIISLDADTLCKHDYLQQIEQFYNQFPNATGCNINFEHNLTEIEDDKLKNAIVQYELYLRYFVESLKITGFPNAFHTIGSCFSVRATTYCKQGGMNIKQAGEDFYFLQKVFYLGNYYELNSAMVYPSARLSNRVIFGTGPSIQKIYKGNNQLMVYSFESIMFFKLFFDCIRKYYTNTDNAIQNIKKLNQSFLYYLNDSSTFQKLEEVKNNVASEYEFNKRLFQYFNNLFIVKGLNYLCRNKYPKTNIFKAVKSLVQYLNLEHSDNIVNILELLRNMQKNRPVIFQQ